MLTNELTFEDMATQFGEITAYGHLEEIERAAGIAPARMTGLDPQQRLASALRAQDAMHEPEMLIAA